MRPGKEAPTYLDKVVSEILERTEADGRGVFCIPASHLTQPLPVGTLVRFAGVDVKKTTVEFKVTEIFTVADIQPDVVYMELQLFNCDDVTADELLGYLHKKHDAIGEYNYWG